MPSSPRNTQPTPRVRGRAESMLTARSAGSRSLHLERQDRLILLLAMAIVGIRAELPVTFGAAWSDGEVHVVDREGEAGRQMEGEGAQVEAARPREIEE